MVRFDLRWKLALNFIGLAGAVIVLVALAINYSLDVQFSRYLVSLEEQRSAAVADAVGVVLQETGSWAAAAPDIVRISIMTERWIQIEDLLGNVVADSAADRRGMAMHGRRLPMQPPGDAHIVTLPIFVDGEKVALGRFGSLDLTQGVFSPQDLRFRATINRSIIWAGAAAVVLAALFSLLLSQRIVRPVKSLTRAAQRMAQGHLQQQVAVEGRDELAYLAGSFNEMAAHLNQLENLRRKTSGDIAHELRTPLTTIQGYIEGMRDGVIAADENNWRAVESDVKRLSRLVQDLQELSRAEAPLWDKQAVDLGRIVNDAVSHIRPLAVEKNLHLEIKGSSDPLVVSGRPEALSRICSNLLTNAVKYSPPGAAITVTLQSTDGWALLIVDDEGPGIPEDEIHLIFERFYRVDSSRTRRTGGSGIGLTIAKELVTAHGGTITAANRTGGGANFVVSLPLRT